MKTKVILFTKSAAHLKKVINWPGRRLLYNFRSRVGKRIVNISWGLPFGNQHHLKEKIKVKPNVRVVLYTKPGCGLCEEMKAEMSKAGCLERYTLEEVDINSQADLFTRYQYEIPVLFINGVEAFRHRLRPDEFKEYVTALIDAPR